MFCIDAQSRPNDSTLLFDGRGMGQRLSRPHLETGGARQERGLSCLKCGRLGLCPQNAVEPGKKEPFHVTETAFARPDGMGQRLSRPHLERGGTRQERGLSCLKSGRLGLCPQNVVRPGPLADAPPR